MTSILWTCIATCLCIIPSISNGQSTPATSPTTLLLQVSPSTAPVIFATPPKVSPISPKKSPVTAPPQILTPAPANGTLAPTVKAPIFIPSPAPGPRRSHKKGKPLHKHKRKPKKIAPTPALAPTIWVKSPPAPLTVSSDDTSPALSPDQNGGATQGGKTWIRTRFSFSAIVMVALGYNF